MFCMMRLATENLDTRGKYMCKLTAIDVALTEYKDIGIVIMMGLLKSSVTFGKTDIAPDTVWTEPYPPFVPMTTFTGNCLYNVIKSVVLSWGAIVVDGRVTVGTAWGQEEVTVAVKFEGQLHIWGFNMFF